MQEKSSSSSSLEVLFDVQMNQDGAEQVLIRDQRLSTPQIDRYMDQNPRIRDFLTDTQQIEAQHKSKG